MCEEIQVQKGRCRNMYMAQVQGLTHEEYRTSLISLLIMNVRSY